MALAMHDQKYRMTEEEIAMKALNNSTEMGVARSVFIETLSDEFIATTGYGVYAYLNPMAINQLFKQYLQQHGTSVRKFVKLYVRNSVPI